MRNTHAGPGSKHRRRRGNESLTTMLAVIELAYGLTGPDEVRAFGVGLRTRF
jgi:hypothetical protein